MTYNLTNNYTPETVYKTPSIIKCSSNQDINKSKIIRRLFNDWIEKVYNPTHLLKLLISDCKLTGSTLEYKLRVPFDKLVECGNYKGWSSIAVNYLNEFSKLSDNVKMLKDCYI